jgi:hypothetical protein
VQANERLAQALARARPELAGDAAGLQGLAREAARELRRWGHDEHELQLERISRIPGEQGSSASLGCLFWCESYHVSQLLALSGTGVR